MNPMNDKEKILIVDDTPTTLSMLREGLEGAGYKVYVATSGEKALVRAKQLMPDLILLDVLMPGMDGFQTCCQLKADKTTRETPIIFMTALSAADKKVRGFKAGAVDYVTKPIELEEVLARIETHLALHRLSINLENLVEVRTAELKQSQEYFCAVANYTYDWETWIDSEGKTKWINPAVERITGYSVDECMVMDNYPLPLIHEEDYNQVADILKEALEGSSGNDKPFRIIEKKGSIRWVAISWHPIYDTKGKSLGYRSSVRDITERKRREQDISLLSFALSNVHEAAFLIDENGCFHFVNEESCHILDYTREELLGMGVSDIDPDFPAERWLAHWNELKRQHSLMFEGRHRTKNGRIFPVEINANYFEYGGRSYNLALVRDITERKQAEEALTIRERELRTLLDNYPDFIVRFDNECRFLYISPAVSRAFGISLQDIVGKRLSELPTTQTSEQIELLNSEIKRAFDQKKSNTLEATWITEKGPQIYEVRHVPELDEHGDVVSVIGITQNITERKRSEEVLYQLNRKLIAISECNQALLRAEDEQTLLNDICHIVCDKAGYHVAWVGFVEHDADKTIRPAAWAGEGSEYIVNTRLSWSESSEYGQGLAGKSIRSGEAIHVQDFMTDPSMSLWQKSAKKHNYRSGVGIPLKDEKNKIFGVFMIYSSQPNVFIPEEINLMRELAGDLAFGVSTLRTRQKRKQAEIALQEAAVKYKIVADNTYDWEFWQNPAGEYIYVSPSSKRITGYEANEFRSDPKLMERIVHPDDRSSLACHCQNMEQKKCPGELEYRIIHTDGSIRWISHLCQPVFDDKGNFMGMRGSNRDITERKRAEIEINRINRILRMLSDSNQALIHIQDETKLLNEVCRIAVDVGGYQMAWVGFAEHDEAKTIRPMAQAGFEPGYLESAGISWADEKDNYSPCGIAICTGQPNLIRNILSDPSVAKWKEAAIRCGYQSVLALPLICDNRTIGSLAVYADQEDVFDSQEVDILKELGGDLAFGISALRTRQERNQAEQDRERLLRDLNAKNKELQSIVYISSHDLRTPLINIQGFSHLLNEHYRQIAELICQGDFSEDNKQKIDSLLREDVPEDLKYVSSSTDRMAEMIDGLLRVSRIGVSEIQIQEIDMNKMISEIFDILKYLVNAAKIKITIDQLPVCRSDEEMLKQLFLNLISNALKYLDTDRKGEICITGRVEGDNYIYCVEDNGIGIAAEHQSKIFELYHRLNPMDSVGGEGLGLTIVSRILDKLNGHIHVESEPGKGSKFIVSLPLSAGRMSSDVLFS